MYPYFQRKQSLHWKKHLVVLRLWTFLQIEIASQIILLSNQWLEGPKSSVFENISADKISVCMFQRCREPGKGVVELRAAATGTSRTSSSPYSLGNPAFKDMSWLLLLKYPAHIQVKFRLEITVYWGLPGCRSFS